MTTPKKDTNAGDEREGRLDDDAAAAAVPGPAAPVMGRPRRYDIGARRRITLELPVDLLDRATREGPSITQWIERAMRERIVRDDEEEANRRAAAGEQRDRAVALLDTVEMHLKRAHERIDSEGTSDTADAALLVALSSLLEVVRELAKRTSPTASGEWIGWCHTCDAARSASQCRQEQRGGNETTVVRVCSACGSVVDESALPC
jgi:hypothetical protein